MPIIKYPELHYNNWYYVQAFCFDKPGQKTTICFAPTKEAALTLTTEWLKNQNLTPRSIHLYLRNYKVEARKMYDAKNFIIAPGYELQVTLR